MGLSSNTKQRPVLELQGLGMGHDTVLAAKIGKWRGHIGERIGNISQNKIQSYPTIFPCISMVLGLARGMLSPCFRLVASMHAHTFYI